MCLHLVENTLINNKSEKYDNLIRSNLAEERDHIEPWIRFASSLNVRSEEELNKYPGEPSTRKSIDS